jgi:magnesium-transporting ATPase (P-type)
MLTGESVPVVKYPVDIAPPSTVRAPVSTAAMASVGAAAGSRSPSDTKQQESGEDSDGDDNSDDDHNDPDSGLADDDRTPPRSGSHSQSKNNNNNDNNDGRSLELKGSTRSAVGAVMVGVGTYIDAPLRDGNGGSIDGKGSVKPAISIAARVMKPIGNDQRSTLYAATRVVQLKPAIGKKQVLGMVVRTAFATQKGSLILSILFPKPSTFKFVQQSFKFTAALFCVAICGLGLSIWQLIRLDSEVSQIVLRGLDLITIVVPPALPLAMTVGANFAMQQLKKQHVFCISPPRINMAGKIKMVLHSLSFMLSHTIYGLSCHRCALIKLVH